MANHRIEIRRRNMRAILRLSKRSLLKRALAQPPWDIAHEAELPRSNMHHHFSTKDTLCFERFDDPRIVLTSYIRAKMHHARACSYGSRRWANEIMHGAPLLGEAFDEPPAEWTRGRQVNIRQRGK
jgi:TetR/AcrR family transcriptional regulator